MSLNLHKDVNNHACAVPMGRRGKTANQIQSYHQEGDTLLVLSVVLPCLEGQFGRLLVSALLLCVWKGSHQEKFPDVSDLAKAMLFAQDGGTDIKQLSMTGVAQATQRLLLQLMTVLTDFSLEEPRKQRHHAE